MEGVSCVAFLIHVCLLLKYFISCILYILCTKLCFRYICPCWTLNQCISSSRFIRNLYNLLPKKSWLEYNKRRLNCPQDRKYCPWCKENPFSLYLLTIWQNLIHFKDKYHTLWKIIRRVMYVPFHRLYLFVKYFLNLCD